MNVYDFNQKLAEGGRGEEALDLYFREKFLISPASRNEQRQGIDRHFIDRKTRERFSVEYKTDKTAGRTGNAFVETVSVDIQNKPGWAIYSQADLLFYFVPDDRLVYVLPMLTIKARISEWIKRYPTRAIPNQGYKTIGLLVPLREFEKLSQFVINL